MLCYMVSSTPLIQDLHHLSLLREGKRCRTLTLLTERAQPKVSNVDTTTVAAFKQTPCGFIRADRLSAYLLPLEALLELLGPSPALRPAPFERQASAAGRGYVDDTHHYFFYSARLASELTTIEGESHVNIQTTMLRREQLFADLQSLLACRLCTYTSVRCVACVDVVLTPSQAAAFVHVCL